ncbi:MAG: hypothetical protein COT17_07085 [Elusimicrobia bacterium CG08_land_8_20_14_0_20_51_18]|nr:MAG: hypothetical protein COT17_07085 [Elusimicrobia bacterium CG08_land_8_20_14_0_20_51_18]
MGKFLVLALLFSLSPLHSQDAVINKSKGKIYAADADGKAIDVKKVKTLREGCTVKTGPRSECEVLFKDGSLIFLSENTGLKIEKAKLTEEEQDYGFNFFKGKVLFFVNKAKRKFHSYKVRTPTAVCAVRGTDFSIIASSESSRIGLFEGAMNVEKDGESRELQPGHEAVVAREIAVADRLSSIMNKEKKRADKLRKYVEGVRAKVEKRAEFIEKKLDKTREKLDGLYEKQKGKPDKPGN